MLSYTTSTKDATSVFLLEKAYLNQDSLCNLCSSVKPFYLIGSRDTTHCPKYPYIYIYIYILNEKPVPQVYH